MNACAMEGGIPNADSPEGVNVYVQYGENLDSLVAPVISKIRENSLLHRFSILVKPRYALTEKERKDSRTCRKTCFLERYNASLC